MGRSQSNGFIECFHRTLLDEHLRVKGRTTWYESVEEMQIDLNTYLGTYNRNRPHRGRGMERRTSYQVFKKGIRKPRIRKKSTVVVMGYWCSRIVCNSHLLPAADRRGGNGIHTRLTPERDA